MGHGAVVHGCTIGNECLVGIHSVIMNGAKAGDDSIIGANTVLARAMEILQRSLVLGMVARIVTSSPP